MAKINNTDQLEALCAKHFGTSPTHIEKLPLSGSSREYFRINIDDNTTVIGTHGYEIRENKAFVSFANSLHKAGLPVPAVLAVSDDYHWYLQTYIKGYTLFDILEKHRLSDGSPDNKTVEIYKQVIKQLPKFQVIGAKNIDFSKCYPRERFDRQSIMWDLNYFKYYFLKTTHTVFDEQLLENDFEALCDYLCSAPSDYFMYRDFQSRNIIITPNGDPYFVDFQGGRYGALQYDIASLLYDGKAAIPPEIRIELLDCYIAELKKYIDIDEKKFREMFGAFAYVRIMQACGSYGYRGFLENKPHFLNSIPPAMRNLAYLLDNHPLPIKLPYLEKYLRSISQNDELLHYSAEKNALTVTVMSFSYRKGIPYDPTGNGGGYVFDCRAIHNPGRYEKYTKFNGKDTEVIDFFAKEPEMAEFVKLTQQIVEISVKKYLKRGFKSLSVLFGCTGGQHRSVFCAERMAEFLQKYYPQVVVKLSHREQDR
ncbi:MAG: phosphotransferase [Bacteroidales bacterium]|nr:phosphotransferase [Bacteroidales bacterium]